MGKSKKSSKQSKRKSFTADQFQNHFTRATFSDEHLTHYLEWIKTHQTPVELGKNVIAYCLDRLNQSLIEQSTAQAQHFIRSAADAFNDLKKKYPPQDLESVEHHDLTVYINGMLCRIDSLFSDMTDPAMLEIQMQQVKAQFADRPEVYDDFLQQLDHPKTSIYSSLWERDFLDAKAVMDLPRLPCLGVIAEQLLERNLVSDRNRWFTIGLLADRKYMDANKFATGDDDHAQLKLVESLVNVVLCKKELRNLNARNFELPTEFAKTIVPLLEFGHRFWTHEILLKRPKRHVKNRVPLLETIIQATLEIPNKADCYANLDFKRFANILVNYCNILRQVRSKAKFTAPSSWTDFLKAAKPHVNDLEFAILCCFANDIKAATTAINSHLDALYKAEVLDKDLACNILVTIIYLGQLLTIFDDHSSTIQNWLNQSGELIQAKLSKVPYSEAHKTGKLLTEHWAFFPAPFDLQYIPAIYLKNTLGKLEPRVDHTELMRAFVPAIITLDNNNKVADRFLKAFTIHANENDQNNKRKDPESPDAVLLEDLAELESLDQLSPKQRAQLDQTLALGRSVKNMVEQGFAPPNAFEDLRNRLPPNYRKLFDKFL